MFTLVLLSASLMGPCGPRGCPRPSFNPGFTPNGFAPSFVLRPAAPAFRAATPMNVAQYDRPYYVMANHLVTHDGVTFVVRGYFRSDTGKITWEPSDPGNKASFDAAKARHVAAVAKPKVVPVPVVRPERAPTAEPGPPPKADAPIGQLTGVPNFGLSPDKMRGNSTYTTTGAKARQFVLEAKAPGGEASKLHVTVIGSDDARAPVVNDLATHPELAALKSHLMVQDYKPGEWEVDESLGFQTNGKPTIIVQSAKSPGDPKGGRVIYRANDYASGPKGLAEAIRKADPNYKPNADPGPSTPDGPDACPLGFTRYHMPYLIGSAFLLFLLFKLPRKEG